jgi:hypothetical protein
LILQMWGLRLGRCACIVSNARPCNTNHKNITSWISIQ